MTRSIDAVREGALDRALADRAAARPALAFAGMVAAVDGDDAAAVPAVLPALLRLPATLATLDAELSPGADRTDAVDDAAARGAALAVERRDVTPGHAASMADVPAELVEQRLDED